MYYLIENRCKCIKFAPQGNVSEVEIIRRKLLEACKTDAALDTMLEHQIIILQRPDPDRANKLCDIEADDKIADKSEVTVLLIPMRTNVYKSTSDSTYSSPSVNNFNESEIKILYTVPINSEDPLSYEIPESALSLV